MNYLLKLSLLIVLFITLSCDKENDIPNKTETKYPIKLVFKEEGNSKLEYWKGGVLTEKPSEKYVDYFKDSECFTYFKTETDNFCKKAEITFLDDSKLILKYSKEINLDYKFVNDTLKVTLNNETRALGVGDKIGVKIYATLRKVKTSTFEHCGGNEFFKQNFDGQFFMNINENQNLPINSPKEMKPEDEVIFYIKEYILK